MITKFDIENFVNELNVQESTIDIKILKLFESFYNDIKRCSFFNVRSSRNVEVQNLFSIFEANSIKSEENDL